MPASDDGVERLTLGDRDRPYEYLAPIVALLVEAGNRPMRWVEATGPFYLSKSGYICELADPIDWQLVNRTVDVPDAIRYHADRDALWDDHGWAEIVGGCTTD